MVIHTEKTKGAVRVVIPQCIPSHCNKMDIRMEHTHHTPERIVLSPKAMAHNNRYNRSIRHLVWHDPYRLAQPQLLEGWNLKQYRKH